MENNTHVDTQVVSYSYSGTHTDVVEGVRLSSVAAKEFLSAYSPSCSQDRYYMPSLRSPFGSRMAGRYGVFKRIHPYTKEFTDQLLLDFNGDFPSLIEFGSNSFAKALNTKAVDVVRLATAHLSRYDKRCIRKKFDFLCDNNITCVPVTREVIRKAHKLLAVFLQGHQPKSDFRNTFNDILILSTAVHDNAVLRTHDNLLARISADLFEAKWSADGKGIVIDFSRVSLSPKRVQPESKGYVNRSWRIHERRAQVLMDNL
jgi:hypothetical protein